MITLYDRNDARLGEISEAQLQFLIDNMEEESSQDQDYYVDEATLDYLIARGADPGLADLLRTALIDRHGLTVRWEKE